MIVLVLYGTVINRNKERAPNNISKYFSLQTNLKLLERREGSSLNVLNGVRSLSMIWVIMGHCMSSSLNGAINLAAVEQNYLLRS